MPADKKTYDEMIRYLRSQLVTVIATVSPDGKPHAATVFFWINDVTDAGFKLYFVTRRHTWKYKNLRGGNDAIAMVIGTEFAPVTVQIDGMAELLESNDGMANLPDLKKQLAKKPLQSRLYAGAFYPKNPFPDIAGEDFAVFRITPLRVQYMRRKKGARAIEHVQILP